MGENLYEGQASLRVDEVGPAEATAPARAGEIHLDQLSRLEQERTFWVLNGS
jgi:hypothetical protein